MLAIEYAEPTRAISLPANLYSCCGKLAVEIRSLGEDRAMVVADKRPDCGSFAFLVRNGVKVPALVAWTSGNHLSLTFEEPIDDARREGAFTAKRRLRRPVAQLVRADRS